MKFFPQQVVIRFFVFYSDYWRIKFEKIDQNLDNNNLKFHISV